jgi:type IV pilus assembly protein PilE
MVKKQKRLLSTKLDAFTMNELLVVVSIIGILTFMAMPKFMAMIRKTKTLEAKIQLRHICQLEKTSFFLNSAYSTNMEEIGFEQASLVPDGGNANYKITITEASNKGFVATATAVTDFDGDGVFNVWEINEKEVMKEVTAD